MCSVSKVPRTHPQKQEPHPTGRMEALSDPRPVPSIVGSSSSSTPDRSDAERFRRRLVRPTGACDHRTDTRLADDASSLKRPTFVLKIPPVLNSRRHCPDRFRSVESLGSSFVDTLLEAPAGVALLAFAEAERRDSAPPWESPRDSDPDAVGRAVEGVSTMSFGELVSWTVSAVEDLAGPWSGHAQEELPWCYRLAPQRRPIAVAISERFGPILHQSTDLGGQQSWWDTPARYVPKRLFRDFSRVCGNGEFTWDGLWTVTNPPSEAHDDLVSAWEMSDGPTSRWLLPVLDGVRVWEIDRPADWVRLVETYPKVATGPHYGWELPGPNQHLRDIEPLLSIPNQHAVRSTVIQHVLPDWAAVAADYQGVHLSWAGLLTTEGYVNDLSDGGVTMLRYWFTERTLWLVDVFGEPFPLDAPDLSGSINGVVGIDIRHDESRRNQDLRTLTSLLGR